MRRLFALVLALALAAPACAQIYPGYGTPTLLGDGSASAPAYSFASESNMGLYRPVLNGLEFTVGGVGVVRLQSNGIWLKDTAGTVFFGSGADVKIARTGTNTVGVQAAGASSNFATLGGVLFLDATVVANSSTLAQILHSYTLPASLLTVNGKTLRITATFTTVNNANAKAVQINICGTLLSSLTTTISIAGTIRYEVLVTRTGLNTQIANVTAVEGINSATFTQAKQSATYGSALACTETATIAIQANVNTTALSDASSSLLMVELLN